MLVNETPCTTDFLNVAKPTKRAATRLVRAVFTGKLQYNSNQKEREKKKVNR